VAEPPTVGGEAVSSREFSPFLGMPLRELERLAVLENLKGCGSNKAETARRLGLSEQNVHNKLKQYRDEAGG
jgi:DNA-binding NtrC family response regulator